MSTDGARPWWASADPDVSGLDPDEDPVTASRAARRGAATGDPEQEADPHGEHAACGACPLCVGWRRLSEQHPEVADHLAAAARHLTAAVRRLVDEADHDRGAEGAPFERIDVDGDSTDGGHADGDGPETAG